MVTITKDTETTGSITIQGGNNAPGITADEVEITNGTVDIKGGSNAAGNGKAESFRYGGTDFPTLR